MFGWLVCNTLSHFLKPYTSPLASGDFQTAPVSTLSVLSSVTTRALELVREASLHKSFGDFDDHLEDVTVDWLRNGAVQVALDAK